MAKSSKPTLKVQLENCKAELQAEKDKGATFHFSSAEIDMIKNMCSQMEEGLKFFDEGGIDEINSISKVYKDELKEVVRNIYHKITFK
jgi:ABC-type antimicrobial peptide transport system ATPase subunit